MKITPDIMATAADAVDTYSGLSPILQKLIADKKPVPLEMAYHLTAGGNPHFTQNDAITLNNFFNQLTEVEAAFKRHFGRGVPSKNILQMCGL